MKAHLFTDADNTLWDTDRVFAAAQLDMLRQIERLTGRNAPQDEDQGLAFLRDLDQKIAATHPDHLRYPAALLAQGLSMVLQGRDVEETVALISGPEVRPDDLFESAQSRFLEAIQRLPALRTGVREGLIAISKAGVPVTIVTEEKTERCRRFVSGHGLEHLIGEVVSVRKTSQAYLDLKRGVGSARCFMVGDQVDRDILAAAAAGFSTFYFPGGFAPYWNADLDMGEAKRIDRYDAIVPDILAETRRPFPPLK
ncbi:HAD family hydrolase [Bradyrhizobium mercantei]|uniref:HAD family hydrolase n=1 Tax=Bradyrhizobium mercantei TaxID=1904807 RepID=UPI000977EF9D|nr:HAD hydrolase-like protein [Bradyrhizobium mercantei]